MNSTHITHSFLVLLWSLFTLTLSTTPAGAQTAPTMSYAFIVNTTGDTHDAQPGDGVCADKKGHCSLRAAIEEADALPTGSSITFTVPAGTYPLTLGTLYLKGQRTITIHGAGRKTTIIKGNNTFGIMSISRKMVASLSQLTVEGGSATNGGGMLSVSSSTISGNSGSNGGGGIKNDGGTLSVSTSTFSSNSAGHNGGGIDNGGCGTLSVSNSTISGNSANGNGGGIENGDDCGTVTVSTSTLNSNMAKVGYGYGGGIENNGGTVSVSTSTLSSNSAYVGGGIENNGGTVSVSTSTLSGNSSGFGGGIENNGGTVSVSTSTLSSNYGGNVGGGIWNNGGTVSVSTSTFSKNSTNVDGGGIENYGGGTVSVSTSTLSGNSATTGGGISNYGSTVTLTGTIVANSPTGENCVGTISEGAGYNVDSGSSCGFSLGSDLNNTDPMLGPLGDNGGPTQTMALLQGSKAIDWVAASSCPASDQRGYVRPDGSGESTCDIGAYESSY